MPRVPAYCPNCGAVFAGPIALGPGASIVLENVITNCPFCGKNAAMEGEFRGTEDAIQVIRSKFITPDALRAFAAILKDAYQKQATIEETRQRAAAIDPALGEAIEKISGSTNLWRASLLVLLLALSRCNFDVKVSLDINDVLHQMMNRQPAEIAQQVPLPKPNPQPNRGKR